MRVDFAAVCDYALVDQYGKLSVLGIFSHIWVGKFPTIHPRLHLVLHLKGRRTEIGEHHVRIRLLDEADAEVLAGDGAVTFAEPPAGVTEIAAAAILVFDVPFARPGRYRFQIELDGALTTEMPITVAHGPGTPSPRPRS
jgi:hypothetical protein